MRKLGWLTVGFTYLLMVWGNLVSATGSGLACPDWPLCHGTVAPPIRFDIILEWGHRCLAFTAGVLILTTVYKVLVSSETGSALKRSGRLLATLLGIQVVLGGVTVLLGLSVTASTIHLLIANIVFAGLITVASVITWNEEVIVPGANRVKRLATMGLSAMVIQLILGALVRHGHAGLACPNFPGCLDGFGPFPFTFETAVAFTHRWWGVLMLLLFARLASVASVTSPTLGRPARQLMALAFAQVILGVGTVLSGLSVHSRAVHAAVGYALWGVLFYIALRAGAFDGLWKQRPSHQQPLTA